MLSSILTGTRLFHAQPREVSNRIAGYLNEDTLDENRSLLLMQWGQIVDHDLDFAPETEMGSDNYSKALCDEHCSQGGNCFPIMVGVCRQTSVCPSQLPCSTHPPPQRSDLSIALNADFIASYPFMCSSINQPGIRQ